LGLVERLFRRKFNCTADGYVIRQWGQDVVFSPAEYRDMFAVYRRVWGNPVIWIGYLLTGVALPAMLFRSGQTAAAWVLLVVSAIVLLTLLVHADRKPNESAEARATPQQHSSNYRDRYSSWMRIADLVLSIMWLRFGLHHRDYWSAIFWGAMAVLVLLGLAFDGWRSWRGRAGASG